MFRIFTLHTAVFYKNQVVQLNKYIWKWVVQLCPYQRSNVLYYLLVLQMCVHHVEKQETNWKMDLQRHAFKKQFSVDYSVTKLDGKVLCLLGSNATSVLKEKCNQNTLPLLDWTFITIFPTYRKLTVGQTRKIKTECLNIKKFLRKRSKGK